MPALSALQNNKLATLNLYIDNSLFNKGAYLKVFDTDSRKSFCEVGGFIK